MDYSQNAAERPSSQSKRSASILRTLLRPPWPLDPIAGVTSATQAFRGGPLAHEFRAGAEGLYLRNTSHLGSTWFGWSVDRVSQFGDSSASSKDLCRPLLLKSEVQATSE